MALAGQRLHSPCQQPNLPFVVVQTELNAGTQRLKATADHLGVGLAVGTQIALLHSRPQSDVRETAQLRLRGDVVHLPFQLVQNAAQRLLEMLAQIFVARTTADVAAIPVDRVVLLQNRKGEKPNRTQLREFGERFLQHSQTFVVALRLKHKANIVQCHAALREEIVLDQ